MATSASLTLNSLASSASAASHSRMASWMFFRASSCVLPWEWQPRSAGQLTETPSSCSINLTRYFVESFLELQRLLQSGTEILRQLAARFSLGIDAGNFFD